MSWDRRLHAEMRRLEREHADPDRYAVDEKTADRLLAGELEPTEVAGPYALVATVFAAAAVPPREVELAGEDAAVAAFWAARRSVHTTCPARSRPVLSKFLGAKAVALAVAGTLSVGGVAAAATGSLPEAAQRVAHDLLGNMGVPAPDAPATKAAQPEALASAGAAGLCRAWSAGDGGEHGKKPDAAAFERLATAAGGRDQIATYCAALPTQASRPSNAHAAAAPRRGPAAPNAGAHGSPPTAKPSADADEVASLCRAWASERSGQRGQLQPAERDLLSDIAGGPEQVADLCRAQVSGAPPAPTHSPGRR
jgi:hypothetical protein